MIDINNVTKTIVANGGNATGAITANALGVKLKWAIVKGDDNNWVTLSKSNGVGDESVTFSANENSTGSQRSQIFKFRCSAYKGYNGGKGYAEKTITVIQPAQGARVIDTEYTITSTLEKTVSASATSATFIVTYNWRDYYTDNNETVSRGSGQKNMPVSFSANDSYTETPTYTGTENIEFDGGTKSKYLSVSWTVHQLAKELPQQPDVITHEYNIESSESSITLTEGSPSTTFTITGEYLTYTNGNLTNTENASWTSTNSNSTYVSVSPTSGSGSKLVTISASNFDAARTATITFRCSSDSSKYVTVSVYVLKKSTPVVTTIYRLYATESVGEYTLGDPNTTVTWSGSQVGRDNHKTIAVIIQKSTNNGQTWEYAGDDISAVRSISASGLSGTNSSSFDRYSEITSAPTGLNIVYWPTETNSSGRTRYASETFSLSSSTYGNLSVTVNLEQAAMTGTIDYELDADDVSFSYAGGTEQIRNLISYKFNTETPNVHTQLSVTYSSNQPSWCTVDSNGNVTATSWDGYDNRSATITITQAESGRTKDIEVVQHGLIAVKNGIYLTNVQSQIKPSDHPYAGTNVYLETSCDWGYAYSNDTHGDIEGNETRQTDAVSAEAGTHTITGSWQVTHGGYTKTLSGSASYTGMNNYAEVSAGMITLNSYMSGGSGSAEASVEKNGSTITSGYLITASTDTSWLNQPTVNGNTVTITAKEGNPNSTERRGSFFVSAVVDGVDSSNVDGTNYYVIQPGIPVQHRITSSGNFYIEGDGYEEVNDGSSATFTVYANNGYEFSSKPSFSHGTVGGWSSSYADITITNVTSDITLTCTSGLTAKQTTTYTLSLSLGSKSVTADANTVNVADFVSTNNPAGTALIYNITSGDSAFSISGSTVSVPKNTTAFIRSCTVTVSQDVTNGKSATFTITQAAGTTTPVTEDGYEIVLGTNEMNGTGSTTILIKKNGSIISPNWSNVAIDQDPQGYAEAMLSDYGNTQRAITVTRDLGASLRPIESSFFIEYYVDGISVANTSLVITWDAPEAV